jgi:hypothetical protein
MPARNFHPGFAAEITDLMRIGKCTVRGTAERMMELSHDYPGLKVYAAQVHLLRQGWLPRNLDTIRCFAVAVGATPERLVCSAVSHRAALMLSNAGLGEGENGAFDLVLLAGRIGSRFDERR